MPTAALRACTRCGGLKPKGICSTCTQGQQRHRDERRGTRTERGYGSRWTALSSQWKAAHPFCGMRADGRLHEEHSECWRQGIRNMDKLHTDHIVARAKGGTDDEDNLQSLCVRCHAVKTDAEDGGFGRR